MLQFWIKSLCILYEFYGGYWHDAILVANNRKVVIEEQIREIIVILGRKENANYLLELNCSYYIFMPKKIIHSSEFIATKEDFDPFGDSENL